MAKFTFLEVHLDGADITANAPFSQGESPEDAGDLGGLSFGGDDESGEAEPTGGSDGSSPLPVVLAVVGLVLGIVVIRRILGGSGEPVLEE
ncbi:MAG: hypothetical protein ABEJ26_12955 [Halosimplex sp.]